MVCAVVVTYNRKKLLLECLEALLAQTRPLDAIYIIDNASTDGTSCLLKEKGYADTVLKKTHLFYVQMPENTGGAGGFHEGIKRAYERGYDWIWVMDDDAVPEPESLLRLLETVHSRNDKCFCSNCDADVEFTKPIKEVGNWLFVGAFIHRSIVESVGLPRKDFFIYHDDGEYAYRIIKYGHKIIKARDSVIKHGDFSGREWHKKIILGRTIGIPKLPDWKFYYYIRNELLKYRYDDINKYKALYHTAQSGLKILLVNKVQFPIFFRAFFHGVIGRAGKIVGPT